MAVKLEISAYSANALRDVDKPALIEISMLMANPRMKLLCDLQIQEAKDTVIALSPVSLSAEDYRDTSMYLRGIINLWENMAMAHENAKKVVDEYVNKHQQNKE